MSAGKPILPPAGRLSNQSALVAEVSEHNFFPDLDVASVLVFAAIDEELCATAEDRLVPSNVPRRLIICFKFGDRYLLGLIDTGAEINLVNDQTVKDIGLPMLNLVNPTRVTLALNDKSRTPLILKHFTRVTLADTRSGLSFDNVELSLGPVAGNYDMILGIPFLSHFHLSVSISQHSLVPPSEVAAATSSEGPCVKFDASSGFLAAQRHKKPLLKQLPPRRLKQTEHEHRGQTWTLSPVIGSRTQVTRTSDGRNQIDQNLVS
ncbi:hypothetical protein PGT21_013884 [Puccinia graminis f. sp. tritici]|uniref:Peptidase A2 domain-containing protein n=1 Tax=Puccinia graminis f. sp. tritici TaxID=56615 RepID=A0A5B0QB57_PUCGR|nr:hypothetical protein PGT21_013884 [Puccinia graminis f. sp. tritici]